MDEVAAAELYRPAEMIEAEFMLDLFTAASPSLVDQLGMSTRRIGGGVATSMTKDPTGGYWSRVVGLGWTEPITDELVESILAWYRGRGATSVTFQVSPFVPQDNWESVLDLAGFTPGGSWVKLARDTSPLTVPSTTLDIRPLGPSDGPAYGETYWAGFGFPNPLFVEWMSAQTSLSKWRTFGAFDGARLAGVGALFLYGAYGGMSGAATAPDFRNRGAQGALIASRIAAAAARDCKWVLSETATETDTNPNPSLHNLHRCGFIDLYVRRNWRMALASP